MSSLNDQEQDGSVTVFAADKPDLATSRRNFLAGMRTAATIGALAGIGVAMSSKSALATLADELADCNQYPIGGGRIACKVFVCKKNGYPGDCFLHTLCFLSGTNILTPGGEVRIDDLRIGDFVSTVTGESQPIKWIGRMRRKNEHGWLSDALPVRIVRSAFADGTPHRDLYISQSHAVYLGGMLISAVSLVNGSTIALVRPESDVLDYFQIELESHNALFAEGAPCESFLVAPGRHEAFDNYQEYVDLFGPVTNTFMLPFAPVASYNGRKGELKSRLRSMISPVMDIRQPVDRIRDELEVRASRLQANAA